MHDVNNTIVGAAGIARDITDKKHKQKEIEHISFHDFLTKLHNRRYFADALLNYDQPRYYPLGVMMIDFNGLKIINDAFGHDVGDEALRLAASLLLKVKRNDDILARIGGDEFALIMPNINQEDIDQMKTAITKIMKTRTIRNVSLSLALGYAIKGSPNEDIGDILKHAENEMYRRKLIEGISARNNSIKAILKTLTKKYAEERIHSERVSNLCELIGNALGLQEDDVKELTMAGMYHDIGKISLPDAILKKPGSLTKEEYAIVKEHTNNGYQILRAADGYSNLAQIVLYHHEWYNGNGYPKGLKGEAIPLYSRIIAVADAFEAMTSKRPYKHSISETAALKELKACAGTQFDPKIVAVFIEQIENAN
jgi:diguanylate cyclase (GGDEF)-like protein